MGRLRNEFEGRQLNNAIFITSHIRKFELLTWVRYQPAIATSNQTSAYQASSTRLGRFYTLYPCFIKGFIHIQNICFLEFQNAITIPCSSLVVRQACFALIQSYQRTGNCAHNIRTQCHFGHFEKSFYCKCTVHVSVL